MKYKFLENIATADAAFEAYGKTLEDLFHNAALATLETMVDTKTVEAKVEKKISLQNEKLDNLLFDWLSEIIYYKDADALLFSKINVKIKKNKLYKLHARISGEEINPNKHNLRSDVKAVTYHMFELSKKDDGWYCIVILDI